MAIDIDTGTILLVKTMHFHWKDCATPVIDFIAAEMNKNVRSPDAAKIRSLNSSNMTACISEWQSLPLWRQILGLGIDPQECAKLNLTSKSKVLELAGNEIKCDETFINRFIKPTLGAMALATSGATRLILKFDQRFTMAMLHTRDELVIVPEDSDRVSLTEDFQERLPTVLLEGFKKEI
ncbi:MAG TPA: hypothetical protein VK463_13280 [Desulfomonilaceae bacterium]|nr:hypothetical protein [Desulfomonilaceae bacterium]